jgi:uncharacterized protein (TIGR01777 family)
MTGIYEGRARAVAITGASGMIGSALARSLAADGVRVLRIGRRPGAGTDILWDPAAGSIDTAGLEGVDAVVHLAGESIASGRWTRAQMQRIRDSRTQGTTILARTLATLDPMPAVLVSASAVGIYGDRGDEVLTETSRPGSGFLPEVAVAWEASAEPARTAGIRVVHPRFAAVLSRSGGVLDRLLLPFRLGLGGPIGRGAQWMPLVSLEDAIGAIRHLMDAPGLSGPFNVSLPTPVTNEEFAEALGSALHRPAVLPVPPAALRLAYGQLADELLIASARVVPAALEASGFRLRHPTLRAALDAALR